MARWQDVNIYDWLQFYILEPRARGKRIKERLQFNDSFSIYGGRRAKWVKAGWRKRQLLKKYLILFGSAFVISYLVLLLLEYTGHIMRW